MSFAAHNNYTEGDDHRSRSSPHENDYADQHEEHQSTHSELPAEIPDSQPDPYVSYFPAEIPDSQPDPYVSYLPAEIPDSQPGRVYHGDLHLGDAQAFDPSDYDLEEGSLSPSNLNLINQENIDPRRNRFDDSHRETVHDSFNNKVISSSSSGDTEIIPGGTRLTERLKDRVVSLDHHSPIPTTLLSSFFTSFWQQ